MCIDLSLSLPEYLNFKSDIRVSSWKCIFNGRISNILSLDGRHVLKTDLSPDFLSHSLYITSPFCVKEPSLTQACWWLRCFLLNLAYPKYYVCASYCNNTHFQCHKILLLCLKHRHYSIFFLVFSCWFWKVHAYSWTDNLVKLFWPKVHTP